MNLVKMKVVYKVGCPLRLLLLHRKDTVASITVSGIEIILNTIMKIYNISLQFICNVAELDINKPIIFYVHLNVFLSVLHSVVVAPVR